MKHETVKDKKKSEKKISKNNHKMSNKITIKTYLSVITLNINGLKTLIKSHRVLECIKKKIHLYVIYNRLILYLKKPKY